MPTNFQFHYILCTTPPDLEDERIAFESAVAQFVEQVTMPDAVLFAPASLRPGIDATRQKTAIDSNIRTCEFFVQIFGEQCPDPVFPSFMEYALQCLADPVMITRNVAVLFRNYTAAAPELRELRERLEGVEQCETRDFRSIDELSIQLRELLSGWYAQVRQ